MDVPVSRQQNDQFDHITRQEDTSSPSHRAVDKDDGDDISTNRQKSTREHPEPSTERQLHTNPGESDAAD